MLLSLLSNSSFITCVLCIAHILHTCKCAHYVHPLVAPRAYFCPNPSVGANLSVLLCTESVQMIHCTDTLIHCVLKNYTEKLWWFTTLQCNDAVQCTANDYNALQWTKSFNTVRSVTPEWCIINQWTTIMTATIYFFFFISTSYT